MDFLNQSAFLKALGWSLLNSFWQFALLWVLFLMVTFLKKPMSATLRHALALVLLLSGFLWFAAGLSYRYFAYSEIPGFTETGFFFTEGSYISSLYTSITSFLDKNLSYLSFVYLLAVAALFVKFFRYFYYSHKIQTSGLTKIRASLRSYVDQLAVKLDISRKVNVWLSEYVDTPIIVGFLKPTILIPVACMNQLTVHQLEAVLLHEMAHIKRNDYLLNLFLEITEIVFFFNPFSRLFTRTIQQERENSCDDWVLQFKFNRYDYASALLSLEKNRAKYLRLTLAATGQNKNKTLLTRIKRIMEVKMSERMNGMRLFAYFLSVALLTFVACFNPGDVVIRSLAKEFPAADPIVFPASETSVTLISNTEPRTLTKATMPVVTKNKSSNQPAPELPPVAEEEIAFNADMHIVNVADLAFDGYNNAIQLVAAVHREERDFSKTDNMPPQVPEVASPSASAFPFVPSASFSFVFVDTSKPKVKAENYYERNARESLVKAKKAVEQLNWEKIEKELNNKVDIQKLRKEIEKSLEELNWQEINDQVKMSLSQENEEKVKALRREAEELENYKAQQIRLQQIHNELNLRQELMQRDIEKQQHEINQQIRQQKKKPAKLIVNI